MVFNYGQKNQVSFANELEYYYALGFLANNRHAELHWEHNEQQGAWASEGRIHCLVPTNEFPQNFLFTAGRGRICARINCNEFVERMIKVHSFSYNGVPNNVSKILATIPNMYKNIFMKGYAA